MNKRKNTTTDPIDFKKIKREYYEKFHDKDINNSDDEDNKIPCKIQKQERKNLTSFIFTNKTKFVNKSLPTKSRGAGGTRHRLE